MTKRKIFKTSLFLLFIIIITLLLSTITTITLASQKIFTINNSSNNTSVTWKQLSDMVVNPAASLKGEDTGQINFLLLGEGGKGHTGGENLTDSIMVVSLKPTTNEAAILSIPRDLYIQLNDSRIRGKINSIMVQGDKSVHQNGDELIRQVVEDLTGFHIHYLIKIDFTGFIQIIDTLGGVDVYIDKDINDPLYPNFSYGYDPFYIKQGWHHLDGATTLKVVRSRHSTMGDFDRIKRQQKIIKAVRQKIYEKYQKADAVALVNLFLSTSQHLQTDLQPAEFPRLYQITKNIKSHNITIKTLDTQNYLNRINVGLGYTLGISQEKLQKSQQISSNIFNLVLTEAEANQLKQDNINITIIDTANASDLVNNIAADLEKKGLRVVKTTNSNSYDITGVKILFTETIKDSFTLKFLQNIFDAQIEPLEDTTQYKTDLIIILGKGF